VKSRDRPAHDSSRLTKFSDFKSSVADLSRRKEQSEVRPSILAILLRRHFDLALTSTTFNELQSSGQN